ncbi:CRISPR-associated protein Cas4 [Candidatus Pacearchaeota archaeon]|nr:CRISPR-associated protein Cas4 [Candidatus Pacearchaeota archaeon]
MKELINVTDITSYLYCPRKLYFKRVKKIKEPLNQAMVAGMLKHRIFDMFNKNEPNIVSVISKKISKEEIANIYKNAIKGIIQLTIKNNENMMSGFKIIPSEFSSHILKMMDGELLIRAESISKTIEKGFLGKELWNNLSPKYLTEMEIISPNLGLKGRIDRIQLSDTITPYEIKTRADIYESDKIQLAAYSLLLEEQFKTQVKSGIVETSTAQNSIDITSELKNKVLEIAEKIRNMQDIPQFNSNFSKCHNCSLKTICFDE